MTLGAFFETLAGGVTSMATAFVNLFTGLAPLFWTPGVDGAAGQPTIITILVLAGVVLTIGFWGIDKIISLSKLGMSGLSKARAKKSRRGV